MIKKVAVIIPSYNEGDRLLAFLESLDLKLEEPLFGQFEFSAVVVDDCSRKHTCYVKRNHFPIYSLRHPVNLGQGAALQTGIEFARESITPDIFVTMDADGQHSPNDLFKLLNPITTDSVDIVFGNRFKAESNVPVLRAFILRAATVFERLITGLKLQDAHNGYRAFNAEAARAINIKQNRMAHATEIKALVARSQLRFSEVPVSIFYSEESLSKGQSNLGAIRILRDLISSYLLGG